MANRSFQKLTRKPRIQARLLRIKRAVSSLLKPNHINPDRKGPANLLLLGIDTLRADHLGFHGYQGGPTSPQLDRLAAGGTIFHDVTAPAPWTLPSFTSALTGVMPGLHGGYLSGQVRNMDQQPPQRLDGGIVTLATHLKSQGYRTAAFYSNQFFAFGLAESFDHHEYYNLPAAELSAIAQDWIRQNADEPFFCFILFNDPHEPTTPDLEDLAHFLPDAANHDHLESFASWGPEPGSHLGYLSDPTSPQGQASLSTKLAVYDATIRSVDKVIGNLQKNLESWQLAENTLVSMFADHGEEFLDHVDFARQWNHDPRKVRGIGHGHTQFQELIHVPWAAWGPGIPVGAQHNEPVSLCDLTPTLLDWLGLPGLTQPALREKLNSLPKELSLQLVGQSQVEPKESERIILAEAIAYGPDLVVVRQGVWKMIALRSLQPLALFNLKDDPQESADIQNNHPEIMTRFQNILKIWNESGTGAGAPSASSESWDDLDDTVRQRLKDLGYSD